MKLPILLFTFVLAVHAEDAKPIDPALAYQTARADAAEAALAVAQRTIKDLKLQVSTYMSAINYCTADWGDTKALEAKSIAAQQALEKLKESK